MSDYSQLAYSASGQMRTLEAYSRVNRRNRHNHNHHHNVIINIIIISIITIIIIIIITIIGLFPVGLLSIWADAYFTSILKSTTKMIDELVTKSILKSTTTRLSFFVVDTSRWEWQLHFLNQKLNYDQMNFGCFCDFGGCACVWA